MTFMIDLMGPGFRALNVVSGFSLSLIIAQAKACGYNVGCSVPGFELPRSEQNGIIAESIQHAIAAGDQERAAQLIEQNGCFLLMSGEVATLLKWADAIEFQSETRPWLAIQKAWALALVGNLERAAPVPRKNCSLRSNHTVEVRTMRVPLPQPGAHCANSRGDTPAAAEYARQALELLPDCSSISQSIRSV